jgi:hypothetical protein
MLNVHPNLQELIDDDELYRFYVAWMIYPMPIPDVVCESFAESLQRKGLALKRKNEYEPIDVGFVQMIVPLYYFVKMQLKSLRYYDFKLLEGQSLI